MRIVVIGDGKVGRTIVSHLASEGHTVVVIDKNPDVIEQIVEQYGLTMDDVNSGRYTWSNGDTVSIDDFEEIYYFYVEVPTNYLMYFFSCAQIMDIKAEFKEEMGVYYSDKLFHTILLETGDASWPIIKKAFDEYSAKWGTNGTERQ